MDAIGEFRPLVRRKYSIYSRLDVYIYKESIQITFWLSDFVTADVQKLMCQATDIGNNESMFIIVEVVTFPLQVLVLYGNSLKICNLF